MNYENEIWKDIVIEKNGVVYDYTGLYQVSNFGRVRSLDRVDSRGHRMKGKIMQYKPRKNGYVYVGLRKNGEKQQQFLVHRLVATAFIPNPYNLPVVNHRDENPSNDVWTNLEWCDAKYNVNYGTCQERKSEKMKGRIFTEEHKQKLKDSRADRTGERNPMYGRTGEKNPMAKKVICLETKQVFNCIREAEDWCGKKGIGSCCLGKQKTVGGCHWQYLDDYKRQLRKQSDINNSKLVA